MSTPLARPGAVVTIPGVDAPLKLNAGTAKLDAAAVPYASADVELPLVDTDVIEELDPRDDVRVLLTAGDDFAGVSRNFDLALRSREVDHRGRVIRLTLAGDETLLQDYAPLADDIGAFDHQGSARGIVDYVLAKIDAALEPGSPDAEFYVRTDATNMLTDPGTAATPGGGYSVANASVDFGDTTWSISGDGDSYNIHTPTTTDSYLAVGSASGTLLSGLSGGKTYVLSATGNVKTVLSGSTIAGDTDALTGTTMERTRALVVHTLVAGGAYSYWHSGQVPNTVNTPTRVSVEFTVPVGVTEAFIRAYLGTTVGQIRWDGFRLSEKDGRPGVDDTEYFDGDTVDTAEYAYEWTGTPDFSTSRRIALVDRAPELLIWPPGVSAWEFLEPITSSIGLRLFCDEQRTWRLIDPYEYALPGRVTVAGWNATEGTDLITRDDPNVYCTGVVVRYRWRDSTGTAREQLDTAGAPGRVFRVDIARPYPGPGAAAAVLARRTGQGRVQDVTALADWAVTPSMEAAISLPATVSQIGQVSSVSWGLTDGLMQVGTRGLTDAEPGSWLAWDPDETWEDVDADLEWEDV